MICTESSSEFRPVDALGFLMGFHVSNPLVSYRIRKLVRGKQHLLKIDSRGKGIVAIPQREEITK
jgi:hypothetical protein